MHPPEPSQASSVHELPSSQLYAVPPHDPPLHTSANVQALPSLQDAVFGVKVHPVAGLHPSSVQPLPSLQTRGKPGLHTPPPQVSPVVQRLPSSHGAVLLLRLQVPSPLHASFVQTLPSSQEYGVPAQLPPEQVSAVVHGSPSSHAPERGVWVQPPAPSQASAVHGFPSSQEYGTPMHSRPVALHVSPQVQGLPSLQAEPAGRHRSDATGSGPPHAAAASAASPRHAHRTKRDIGHFQVRRGRSEGRHRAV